MRFRTKAMGLAAAGIALVATLAGCSTTATPGDGGSSAPAESGTFASGDSGTLIFGVTPDQAGSDASWKPLEDYIAKETGKKVEYYPTADYTALIAAAVAGKIDIMSSGGLQYVMAVNKGASLAPVAAVWASKGVTSAGYYSEMIVPSGSSITDPSGAKGKTVCFVDPNSTSGFLFGLYQLSNGGISVDATGTNASGEPTFADFTPFFAGAHDKSAQAVSAGQCDVGFAEDSVADTTPGVTVIHKELVPGGPLAISTKLPADLQAQLTSVLQGATPDAIGAAGITMTDGFKSGYYGVDKIDKSYYDGLTSLCKTIAAAKCSA